MAGTFKSQHNLQERQEILTQMLVNHPDHIPIICEKAERSSIPEIENTRFLISSRGLIAQLVWLIRSRIKLSKSEALYVFVGETLLPTSAEIGSVYQEHKDEDGFLYVVYAGEETFGYL